jgi:hypothetical protein
MPASGARVHLFGLAHPFTWEETPDVGMWYGQAGHHHSQQGQPLHQGAIEDGSPPCTELAFVETAEDASAGSFTPTGGGLLPAVFHTHEQFLTTYRMRSVIHWLRKR